MVIPTRYRLGSSFSGGLAMRLTHCSWREIVHYLWLTQIVSGLVNGKQCQIVLKLRISTFWSQTHWHPLSHGNWVEFANEKFSNRLNCWRHRRHPFNAYQWRGLSTKNSLRKSIRHGQYSEVDSTLKNGESSWSLIWHPSETCIGAKRTNAKWDTVRTISGSRAHAHGRLFTGEFIAYQWTLNAPATILRSQFNTRTVEQEFIAIQILKLKIDFYIHETLVILAEPINRLPTTKIENWNEEPLQKPTESAFPCRMKRHFRFFKIEREKRHFGS